MITKAKVERFLLQLTLFLIPANLAYHWYSDAAYINGRLIDYLLPKLYLSDIAIIFLLILALTDQLYRQSLRTRFTPLLITFLLFITFTALSSNVPSGGIWFVFKILELLLLGFYISFRYRQSAFFRLAYLPLAASILLQSLVGLYQYIAHKSVIGYLFFGEVDLKNIGLAQTNMNGLLEVAPYGTTPHPNVLAGFLVIASTLFLLSSRSLFNFRGKSILTSIVISLSTLVILITGSLSATSGAILLGILYLISFRVSTLIYRLLLLITVGGTLIFSLLFTYSLYHSSPFADIHSIAARYELNQVAFSLFKAHPIVGIGLNQFAAHVPFATIASQRTLFLQPVHYAPLLLLAELGLIGAVLLVTLGYFYLKSYHHQYPKSSRSDLWLFLPLIGSIYILCWDHYPITLQTGQLLTTIALTLPFLVRKN